MEVGERKMDDGDGQGDKLQDKGERKAAGGRKRGVPNYQDEEDIELAKIFSQIKPQTARAWKTVVDLYERWCTMTGKPIRDERSVRNRIAKLNQATKVLSDPSSAPTHVRSLHIFDRSPRAKRLFNTRDGRMLNIAVDHGIFNDGRFLAGIESMSDVLKVLVQLHPNSIQLSPGQAHLLLTASQAAGSPVPALILRCDVSNVYTAKFPCLPFCELQNDNIIEEAIRLDAAGVICTLLKLPEDAPGAVEIHKQTVRNVCTLRNACTKWNMPLIVEVLAVKWNDTKDSFVLETDMTITAPLARLACELGGDILKCDPPANIQDVKTILHVCQPSQVLLRGSDKGDEESMIEDARKFIEMGAAGLVYGR
eukprot:768617-Hanusia_phi.AAC.5